MPEFIESDLEGILQEWEEFAETLRPAAEGLTREELRDAASEILRAVALDMKAPQSERARHDKSLGNAEADQPVEVTDTARGHAAERLGEGFTLNQLVAEYRALRASVVRRWRAQLETVGEAELEELIRFNEAIDASLTFAIGWYHARIEDARDLLNGVLAHDLRSPLGAVLTSADVLLRDDSLSARQTRTVLRMRNSATRMRSMINDLLDFTRTRLGTGLPMAMGKYSMATMIRDVLEEQRAFHPEATLRFETRGNLMGFWDHARVEQLLANLIGNAVEHGGQSPVTVIAEGREDEVILEVHNRDGAIPEEEQRTIFDPLRRAAMRHGQEQPVGAGLGLGLYIARQIAEAHDGSIRVTSSHAAGTTFTVRLPRRPRKGAATAGIT